MAVLLRHILAFAVALSLLLNPVAWRDCAAMGSAPQADIAASLSPHHGHDHVAQGHTHRHVKEHPAVQNGASKCCAMCCVATNVPSGVVLQLVFKIAGRLVSTEQNVGFAAPTTVDPGIPKRAA